MKTVAPYPAGGELPGQRIGLGDRRLAAMERGIEASHLTDVRRGGRDRADRGDVVRLMQRRERHQTFQCCQDLIVDQHRC